MRRRVMAIYVDGKKVAGFGAGGGKVPIVTSPPSDEKITFWLNTETPVEDIPAIDPPGAAEKALEDAKKYTNEYAPAKPQAIPAFPPKSEKIPSGFFRFLKASAPAPIAFSPRRSAAQIRLHRRLQALPPLSGG